MQFHRKVNSVNRVLARIGIGAVGRFRRQIVACGTSSLLVLTRELRFIGGVGKAIAIPLASTFQRLLSRVHPDIRLKGTNEVRKVIRAEN